MITQSLTVTYRHRGTDWQYRLWLDDRGWYWQVGHMDGIEDTEAAASSAAKRYIKGHRLPPVQTSGEG